jgi:hypothetical protein
MQRNAIGTKREYAGGHGHLVLISTYSGHMAICMKCTVSRAYAVDESQNVRTQPITLFTTPYAIESNMALISMQMRS